MIVKVLGRSISISVVSRRLRELWNPRGEMYVMDLPRQFFMIRFEVAEEYLSALTGGPWRVFGSHLLVQAWSPDFDPLRDEIVTAPVWVRLSNIPVTFYHKSILMGIAKGLGTPIKDDLTTLKLERARFARVCVEVNLKKPLKGTMVINGGSYFVSYEGLTNICSSCGLYGHLVHTCPKVTKEKQVVRSTQKMGASTSANGVTQMEDGFTLVRRSSRKAVASTSANGQMADARMTKTRRNLREITGYSISENIAVSNSFGNLEVDLVSPEMREVRDVMRTNKENEIRPNQDTKGKNTPQVKPLAFGAVL